MDWTNEFGVALAYDPAQPREPKGVPEGGEWVENSSSPTGYHHRVTGKSGIPPQATATTFEGKKAEVAKKTVEATAQGGIKDDDLDKMKINYANISTDKQGDIKYAVDNYAVGVSYTVINPYLRGENELKGGYKKIVDKEINDLRSAFDHGGHQLTKPVTLFRGVGKLPFTLKIGEEFTDKGFTSTTADQKFAEEFVGGYGKKGEGEGYLLNIRVPAGEKILVPLGPSNRKKEVVLKDGTSYKVSKIEGNQITIDVVTHVNKPMSLALWANDVQRQCLIEAGDDVNAGLAAAEIILSTQPVPLSVKDQPRDEVGKWIVDVEDEAHEVSGKAYEAGFKAIRSNDKEHHEEASRLHREAAIFRKEVAEKTKGRYRKVHLKMAASHEKSAIKHERILQPIDAAFAHDIHNRRAQGVLNRALKSVRRMTADARRDLSKILKRGLGTTVTIGSDLLNFVDKYRLQLAKILTTTQLAALLEGAQEVANKVPPLGNVPIEGLPVAEQELVIEARRNPPTFSVPALEEDPDGIHYPTISAAVKNLAERKVVGRQEYDSLDTAARAKAFTVANVAAEETLTKIRDSLAENVREGADYETWHKKVLADVDQGTFMSDAHSETVFRTNVQTAFSDGQASVLAHPLVRSGFPYSTYDAIHDDRVRENHLALEKLGISGTNIYRNDDPVFQMFRPPWDYSDRCGWTPITVRHAAELGIAEAEEWLRTGVEPFDKAWVKMPDFQPPEGFRRSVSAAPLSIQLSMQSMMVLGDISLGMVGNEWRGPNPPGDPKRWKAIQPGPRGGKRWVRVSGPTTKKQVKGGGHGGQHEGDRRGGVPDDGEPQAAGGGVAPPTGGPDDQDAGIGRKGAGKSAGAQATGGVPRTDIGRVNQRIARYAEVFKKKGNDKLASVMEELRDQLKTVGAKTALEVLGEAERGITLPTGVVGPEQGTPAAKILAKIEATKSASERAAIIEGLPPDQQDYIKRVVISKAHRVQYEGAYDDLWYSKVEDQFVKKYLERVGITLVQSGTTYDPKVPLISTFSEKNLEVLKREGRLNTGENYIPTDQTLANKLEESKLLPGLETSADVDEVVGDKVTAFTPEVMAAFDKKYGKGRWLVKSYGAEAYAGFGVVFPQRAKQVQEDAKFTLNDAKYNLKERGYKLTRDADGVVNGVVDKDKTYLFGTPAFDALDKVTKRYGKQAQQASFSEGGMRLPMSPEDTIRSNYQTSLLRDDKGIPTGITYWDGKDYKFGTPAYQKIAALEGGSLGSDVDRAVESDEWRRQGFQTDPKFMVQPAFKAVGVTDADRAAGATWETAKEGRVHITTRGGKATAIPYATMTGRGDALPAAIRSDDILAMEKAVEDAINRLPDSERTGQMYAPDVMKTDKGWKVLELNPSAEGGGSDWLGQNPFVIDAVVAHMTGGREPQHVKFIRKLLKDSGVKIKSQKTDKPVEKTKKQPTAPTKNPVKGNAQPSKTPTDTEIQSKPGHRYRAVGDIESIMKEKVTPFSAQAASRGYIGSSPRPYSGFENTPFHVEFKSDAVGTGNNFGGVKKIGSKDITRIMVNTRALERDPEKFQDELDKIKKKFPHVEIVHFSENNNKLETISDTKSWKRAYDKYEKDNAKYMTEEELSNLRNKIKKLSASTALSHDVSDEERDSSGKWTTDKASGNWKAPDLDDEHEELKRTIEDNKLDESDFREAVKSAKMMMIPPDALESITPKHYEGVESQRDYQRILKGIDEGKKLPASIAVRLPDGSYKRVAGGHRLIAARAKGLHPPVLLIDMSKKGGALSHEDQPRKPAGSSEGGQFASGDQGGRVHTVRYGPYKVKYSIHADKRIAGPVIPLTNYRQRDDHSCGFVAALAVVKYLSPGISSKDVLSAVRPTKSGGIDRRGLTRALKQLGVDAMHVDDLTIGKLRRHVEDGTPVLVTVYPEDWLSDHWTAVQGFDGDRIYLTNYKSLSINQFRREWFDAGEGLVCVAAEGAALAFDPDEKRDEGGKWTKGGDSGDPSDAVRFVSNWTSGIGEDTNGRFKVILPTKDVISALSDSRPDKPIRVYRSHKIGRGAEKLESWTTERELAETITENEEGRVTITRVVHPTEILYDGSKLPPEFSDHAIESEVVVANGKMAKDMATIRGEKLTKGEAGHGTALSSEKDVRLSTSTPETGRQLDRDDLIAGIVFHLFGDEAEAVAEWLVNDDDLALSIDAAFAIPVLTRRYGPRPGLNWSYGGISRNGKNIWLWHDPLSAAGQAAANTPTPTSQASTSIPPVVASAPPLIPAPAVPSSLPAHIAAMKPGGTKAKAASEHAYHTAMSKLNNGQALTIQEKLELTSKLTNMPTWMLKRLHGELVNPKHTQQYFPDRKSTIDSVKSLLQQSTNTMTPSAAMQAGYAANPNRLGINGSTVDPATVTAWHHAGWFWTGTGWTKSGSKKASGGAKAAANTADKVWETGKPEPGTLNGVKFDSAPSKFWEKVKDVDVGEPPPLRPVERAGILIQEPDGRIWIVKPTNRFGKRDYTFPGGGVEPGLTDQQNALKEVWEETGLQVEITGHLGDFEDSNTKKNGRLYIGKRVGGAPWDAKIESKITSNKTGKPAAESEEVVLVTPERAAKLLHRTDDLAQLMAVNPIKLDQPTSGDGSEPLKKFLNGIAPAKKVYKDKKEAAGLHTGNIELHIIQEMREFNGLPKVIDKTDMDALIAKGGHVDMLRGLADPKSSSYAATSTAATLADEFRYGDHFPGHGCFGAGTYAGGKVAIQHGWSPSTYNSYGGGATVRIAFPKTAKIISASDLEKLCPTAPDLFQAYDRHSKHNCWRGVQAALAGYDAIYVDKATKNHGKYGIGYYAILNRSILVVQKEDATGHQIK